MYRSILLTAVIISGAHALNCSFPEIEDPEKCCPTQLEYSFEDTKDCDADTMDECEHTYCYLRVLNLMSEDRKLDRAAIKAFAMKGKSLEWDSAIDVTLNSCFADLKEEECAAVPFFRCFFLSIYKNCPATVWNNEGKCPETKLYFQNCNLDFDEELK